MRIVESLDKKYITSNNYNSVFNKSTGFFMRWGENEEKDPIMAPMPEILDLEISQGKCSGNCPECYKNNGSAKEIYNMDFQMFRKIFHKVADTVVEIKFKDHRPPEIEELTDKELDSVYFDCYTKQAIINRNLEYYNPNMIKYIKVYNRGLLNQIAFGICDLDTNPDFLKMMKYCREFDVIPNFTFNGNGLTDKFADDVSKICGAVAVSLHKNTYDAVKMLTDKGMTQINIHVICHDKSYDKIMQTVEDIKIDKRLKKLNALVLLRYKPKGRSVGKFNQLSLDQYITIIKSAIPHGVNIGFDSCSAPIFFEIIKAIPELKETKIFVEPCESALFSSYINCKGKFYACSFCENEKNTIWENGIDVLKNNFYNVWYNDKTKEFRKLLLENNRECPMFNFGGL